MSDSQDIRAWAVEAGWDVATSGRLRSEVVRAYEDAHAPGEPELDLGLDGEPMEIVPSAAPSGPESAPASSGEQTPAGAERAPQEPPRPARGIFSRRPRQPRPRAGRERPRVSLENLVSSGWALGAMALARSPQAIPISRVMQLQAPVAGVIVEDVARGTMLDRLLQPFARGGAKAEMTMALVGPPVLVGAMTARPELAPALRPLLKMAMTSWLQISGPAIKKVQKRAEHFAEQLGDVDLDAMIDALWTDGPVPASPEVQEHIRRERGDLP